MRVHTRTILQMTDRIGEYRVLLDEFYEDLSGRCDKVCSGGDPTAEDLEKTQAAQTAVLNADYNTAFAQNENVLNQQQARLNYIAANPMGYTPQQLATARTSVNEETATAAKQAIGSAAAYAATHGGADVGGGATGQIAGQIGSQAAQSKAQALSSISQQNEALKQQNFWKAIGGLNEVGSEYGSAAGTAAGSGSSTANSSVNAGQLALASQQAGIADIGSMISGISGLGKAFLPGSYTGAPACWVAAATFDGWTDPRTDIVRRYLFGPVRQTWIGRVLTDLYVKYGERASRNSAAMFFLRPIFRGILKIAERE